MKSVNLQCVHDVPDEFPWIARNRNGILIGFRHAPVRDFNIEEWVDSVDGSCGEIVPYDAWDTSAREMSTLLDIRKTSAGVRKKLASFDTAKKYLEEQNLKRKKKGVKNGKKRA